MGKVVILDWKKLKHYPEGLLEGFLREALLRLVLLAALTCKSEPGGWIPRIVSKTVSTFHKDEAYDKGQLACFYILLICTAIFYHVKSLLFGVC